MASTQWGGLSVPDRKHRRSNRKRGGVGMAVAAAALATASLGAAPATATGKTPATLGASLSQALSPAVSAGAVVSAIVLAPGNTHSLAAINPSARLAPGAAWPLVTDAAALWHLGAAATVQTAVEAPAPKRGTVLGDLVLVGGGDPLLTDADIQALASTVARSVHTVTGSVLADGARFAYPQVPAGWPLADTEGGIAPAASALSVNGDGVTVTVTPAASAGGTATVSEQPSGLVPVSGAVSTVASHASGPAPTPAIAMDPSGSTVLVSGSIPVGATPVSTTVYPASPARLAAAVMRRDLIADGVHIQGTSGVGLPIPTAVVLAHETSSPIGTWGSALFGSGAGPAPTDAPIVAENLFRLLCEPTPGRPCGPSADVKEVGRFLAAAGAGTDAQVSDGSGLSTLDRISAGALAQVLEVAGLHAWGASLVSALPPLSTVLPGAPAGTVGLYAASGQNLALVARVPGAGGKGSGRIVSLLVNDLTDTALAPTLATQALLAAAGSHVATKAATPSRAFAPVTTAQGRSLLAAVGGAGPGSSVAVTAWPVGARAPTLNLNGGLLLPATGIVPTLVAATALPKATQTALDTRAVVDGTLSGTTLHGSVGLEGGLDPGLQADALSSLARQVRSLGIARVTGGVTVDDHMLAPTVPSTWPWQSIGTAQSAAGDALTVGNALYSVAVLPGSHLRASPTVDVVPASTPVTVTDEAHTVSGSGQTLALWPVPGTDRLVLTGTIGTADRLGTVFLRSAPDPAMAAGRLFLADLQAAGVRVSGGVSRAPIPSVAPSLAVNRGNSLATVVDGLLTTPDAAAAWDLSAVLGGALHGVPGSQAVSAGLAGVAGTLDRDGKGAPAALLTDPVGVGQDDLVATYGCAAALADLAAAKGPGHTLPALLPLVPTSSSTGATVRAVEGSAPGQGSIIGYATGTTGATVAFCASFSSLDRSPSSVLAAAASAAAGLVPAPAKGGKGGHGSKTPPAGKTGKAG